MEIAVTNWVGFAGEVNEDIGVLSNQGDAEVSFFGICDSPDLFPAI